MPSTDTTLGLLLAALVVLSAVPAASAGAAGSHAQQATQTTDTTDETPDPADAIYVRENGSAVLVYNQTTDETDEYGDVGSETPTNVEYGADISSNLFYLLVTEPVEGETNATGQASLLLQQSNVSGNGQLSVDQPDSLSSLAFQLNGETTAENAASNMSLNATFDGEETSGSEQFESASTTGNVTVTGSDYTAYADFDAQFDGGLSTTPSTAESYELTEDDGSYTVDVERDTTLSFFEAEDYATRAQARDTIERQFQSAAVSFGGTADVTIERYDYSNETNRLDIAYTVEYTGVESGVTELLAQQIATSEDIDIDGERAEELTTQMRNLQIDRVAASYEVNSGSASGDVAVELRNYDDVLLPALEIAQAADEEELEAQGLQNIDEVADRIEAQQASELEQQVSWSATVDKPSARQIAVTAEADYTTDNWGAYVSELESRDIETYETSYEVNATTTDDDRVRTTGTFTVDGDVYSEYADQLMAASAEDEESQRYLTAFLQADPQRGKVNVSVDEENVRVEVGAQFNNLSALRDAFAENETVPAGMTSVVGRTEGNTTTTYVRVQNAVGADASESDVRALSFVDEDTTVHMPGDWDREFPTMDTERAASFLGVEATPASSGSGPGFGVGVTIVALLSAALLARRRA